MDYVFDQSCTKLSCSTISASVFFLFNCPYFPRISQKLGWILDRSSYKEEIFGNYWCKIILQAGRPGCHLTSSVKELENNELKCPVHSGQFYRPTNQTDKSARQEFCRPTCRGDKLELTIGSFFYGPVPVGWANTK